LRFRLEANNYEVLSAFDGQEGLAKARSERPDLIILDLMLPKISGEQLCLRWRREGMQTPIIMLTAKGQERERVAGLNLGADDYITKPFSLEELLARMNAVLRRTDPGRAVGQMFRFADLEIDVAALKARRRNTEIDLTPREAKIIQYFAANPNRIVGRKELYEKVWEDVLTDLDTRTTDMHIAKLRAKIEPDVENPQIIRTVRGAGYRYET